LADVYAPKLPTALSASDELVEAVAQHAGHRVEVPGVGDPGHDPPVQRLDAAHGLGQVVLRGGRSALRADRATGVEGDDVGALGGQSQRVGPALAARRAGDERDLAGHPAPGGCDPGLRRAEVRAHEVVPPAASLLGGPGPAED